MKKILILANHYTTVFHLRKELLKKLLDEGHEIYVCLPADGEDFASSNSDCKIIPVKMTRRGMNPFKDLALIRSYKKVLKDVNPDIVLSYTIKPNIYGCLANKGKYKQVCNITGTGATFLKDNFLSRVCRFLYRVSLRKCYKVFFQNVGDRDYFIKHKMIKDNYAMLPGSGCNLEEHPYSDISFEDGITKFIFIGRVMKLKGIDEYLGCAKAIKTKYPDTRFYIAGWNEEEDYRKNVQESQDAGYVEYIGFRKDITDWIRKCCCTILPSHGGEGIPNALLESSATGRICIASDINGSRDVVEDGKTGFLFKPGDAKDLTAQVEKVLAMTPDERIAMGRAGREKIEREYDRNIVINIYLNEVNNA